MATVDLRTVLTERQPAHSLPGALYRDTDVFEHELEHLWMREWLFAGPSCAVAIPGSYLTMHVGPASLLVVRGNDGVLRAMHNVCRHRGARLCDAAFGNANLRIVCPYHQWAYNLDGSLFRARSMADDFDPSQHGLAAASCEEVAGMVFVCFDSSPPPFEARDTVAAYLAPFDLVTAKVAHTTTTIEHGNWKLVMENNRECYHCRVSHPELCAVFPEAPLHSGGGDAAALAEMHDIVERCEALGMPSRYHAADDFQYRAMRMPLLDGARSMTADGKPAVSQQFGTLPDAGVDIGDVLLYHYPNTWNHFVADHAVVFRIVPITSIETELVTTWLVPAGAVEGVDYDVANLTAVWQATNTQDIALVERAQRGIASPAYRPGPYSPVEEAGVIQFVDWYAATMLARLPQ
jgi:Rieske 2Fe-2S family protein